jgi:hypothetical protein
VQRRLARGRRTAAPPQREVPVDAEVGAP